jgi:hypothetical protein
MKLPSVVAQNALVKQPTEDWVFTMPMERLLDGLTIASIAAVRVWIGTYPTAPHTTAIADPENPSGAHLKLEDSDVDGDDVLLQFSAGVHEQDYYIEIDVLTTTGLKRSADGWLLVRDHK